MAVLSNLVRYGIFARDGFACQYCGAGGPYVRLTVDHVLPVSAGGGDEPTNLVTACHSCNCSKNAHVLDDLPQAVIEALDRPYEPLRCLNPALFAKNPDYCRAAAFSRVLSESPHTHAEVARGIGVDRTTVSLWAAGRSRASRKGMRAGISFLMEQLRAEERRLETAAAVLDAIDQVEDAYTRTLKERTVEAMRAWNRASGHLDKLLDDAGIPEFDADAGEGDR